MAQNLWHPLSVSLYKENELFFIDYEVVFTNYILKIKKKKEKRSNLKINLNTEHAQLIKYAGAIAEPLWPPSNSK